MDHRKIILSIVAGTMLAAPFLNADDSRQLDDPPAGAVGKLLAGTLSSGSSSAGAVQMVPNTIEGEDFYVDPLTLRRPAAGVQIVIPATAASVVSTATLGSGPLTPTYIWRST